MILASNIIGSKEATKRIHSCLYALSKIKKPLDEALGYYLAENIAAERDYPPFDRITHDGIAIHYASFANGQTQFLLENYAAAGCPQLSLSDARHAIEVATGAPLPTGCDTVIPYESLALREKIATLLPHSVIQAGDALHLKGSDMKEGQIILNTGQCISVPEITVLAANGIANVPVHAKPEIGILATGNELVSTDATIQSHQIRRSNDRMLKSALALNGFSQVELEWAPDEKEPIYSRLCAWLGEKEIILITGGVSRGVLDYVPEVLKDLGVEELFHHVAQRPGKPLWFGRKGKTLVFGLPGNPNSALICLVRYVLPALKALCGGKTLKPQSKALEASVKGNDALALFVPAMLTGEGVIAKITHTSGDFAGLLGSDGFVELPAGRETYLAGEKVNFYPWRTQ